ncbi:hypothetical protein C9374_014404 [Naegleria lovaniensis]|uniref:Phosphopantetheine adenylyltransferase n=1 Tax=Naegleria lovaniensis TaxID=51637 RepID=A0AA88KPE0_NAELO|nr:uncharacterized protein C9374_014404 [Naegleria lovaniensis]KAG2389004.1 hypothetical protein C9374_014404 [Naegleria lovaniensis]
MNYAVSLSLLTTGVIHLLPLSGAIGSNQLHALYGIPIQDPNLIILMRHRAVLFGILGSYLCYAAFQPRHVKSALMMGLTSVISFMVLAYMSLEGYNKEIAKVFKVDVVALVSLVVGTVLHYNQK